MEGKQQNLRIALAVVWLILTSSLALWWMIFVMRLISTVESDLARHRAMLFWEGLTLLGLLLVGGSTLIYFILQEKKQARQLKLFFSGFTHDVKTRLAGVKLQAESLRADNQDQRLNGLIDRLLTDTSRLQVQVENSLFVGGSERAEMYSEKIRLWELFEILKDSWPQIKMRLHGDAYIEADRRAFESIVTNIFHNALSHGQATEIEIRVIVSEKGLVRLTFSDNGAGFRGDVRRLGEIFYRHNPSSGSGLGLYTARESLKRMRGQMGFQAGENGFVVFVELPGVLV